MTVRNDCAVHGRQDLAFVCRHIAEALADGEPRGFFWNFAEGAFEAVCEACNDLTEEQAMAIGPDLIAPVCYGCFCDAAATNGVDIS